MHRERVSHAACPTSVEPEKVAETVAYSSMLGIIFTRPQKVFYLRNRDDNTITKRVRVLTPSGWQLVPLDPADYPEFVENYLS